MAGCQQTDGATHAASEKSDPFSKIGAVRQVADGMQKVAAAVVERGSLFLPTDFNFVITSKWSKGTKGTQKDVVIKNGQLISGVIDKASIGAEEPESVLTESQRTMAMQLQRNSSTLF